MKNQSEGPNAQEPGSACQPKRITFSSIENQEAYNYEFWLSLTPEQRLQNITMLIEEIYKDELAKPVTYSRIVFNKI